VSATWLRVDYDNLKVRQNVLQTFAVDDSAGRFLRVGIRAKW